MMPKINTPNNNNEFSLTEKSKVKLVFPYKRRATREESGTLGEFQKSHLTDKQKRARDAAIVKNETKI